MWKGAALNRRWCWFEARQLLEEIPYHNLNYLRYKGNTLTNIYIYIYIYIYILMIFLKTHPLVKMQKDKMNKWTMSTYTTKSLLTEKSRYLELNHPSRTNPPTHPHTHTHTHTHTSKNALTLTFTNSKWRTFWTSQFRMFKICIKKNLMNQF